MQVVDDSIFHKISNTITPQGILCVMRQWKDGMETWDRVTDGIFLVLEGVQDPGNLGTIFRTGEGANERVFIPMCGQVESLNAAVSASLLIYEAYRQKDLHL